MREHFGDRGDPPDEATLRHTVPGLDACWATIGRNPRSTLRPARGDTHPQRESLDALAATTRTGSLTLEGLLGEGGMGRVHSATQLTLGRKVAVKSLRPDARRPEAVFGLLHEAWIAAGLEHPNVVPVHDMALDAQGEPLIVLKRVEGASWAELLADPAEVVRRFGVDEPLIWHLGILMEICTTVFFAHSRGILHRDLKPENVMIGAYGEIYLLDWGIAVSLRDDGSGRLPLAADVAEMAGTPVYMAPEMLARPGSVLTERTDVYLLGAVLFEILAGRPPHAGRSVMDILLRVLASKPEFPEDAPPELVSLCRQAMAPEPEDRLESADALRRGLKTWLERRPAMLLTAQAERCLAELSPLLNDAPLGAGATPGELEAADARRRLRYKLLGECRFGFRQALSIWADNGRARDGLRWALRAMLDHEIRQGDHRAAEALLPELEPPSPELERAVFALRRRNEALAAEAERARTLAAELDHSVGTRTKRFFIAVLGVLWTVVPIFRALVGPAELAWRDVAAPPAAFLAITAALFVWARDTMTRTLINKRTVAILMLTFALLLVVDAGSAAAGLRPLDALRIHPVVAMCVLWTAIVAVDLRFWPSGVVATLGAAVVLVHAETVLWAMSVCNLALAVNGFAVWTERTPREPL